MNASQATLNPGISLNLDRRAEILYQQDRHQIFARTDRMFAGLMVLQWAASLAAAYWLSPRTWIGATSQTHIHVWLAFFLGGTITILPVFFALRFPGATITRHTIAVAQMLTSGLLIHLTGGRIETHFHVFGSLAFLAFYRDWKVLITATVVVAGDHLIRGIFWPHSVYGVEFASGVFWAPIWRTAEHAGWVVFEDIILLRWCVQGNREMREIAQRTAELETTNERIEQTVMERTAELGASEERSRTIINLSSDAFIAMASDGRIVEWNNKAEATFGFTRDEVLGKSLAETFIPPRYRAQHEAGLARYLETGEGPVLNKRIELTAINRTGVEFPVELSISPIHVRTGLLFSAFVRDITARKQAESELNHAKEAAEAASQAKGDFLANMSHEIRTPLNGIVGMTELALDTDLTAGQREYLTTVKSCSDSLLTVINDILDFSKIEAGMLSMDCVGFNVSDLMGETCKTLGLRAHQKGLELACRVAPNVPHNLLGDPNRLRQIILNLSGNAIKFTKQGEVVVQTELSLQTENEVELHFTVTDTGIGIPPEKLERIFKAFEQADNSTMRTYGGTGLGLAIASRLIELMGGRVWVESTVGHGSAFHFTARFQIDTAAAQQAMPKKSVSLENLRVLVVDDNATNRRILEEVLQNWRMTPTLVESGRQALEALELAASCNQPYSLVLLDAQMPEMDGFMLVERIKSIPQLAGTMLMMLSSAAQLADSKRCRELGVGAYLTKPIRQSELLDTILLLLFPAESPRGAVRKQSETARGTDTAVSASRHILLAEDNPVNQRVATRILEKHGHTVNTVENGADALKAIQMEQFDLVLMDLQMPEMDGFAATAGIREMEKTTGRHLPIVAMTARAMKGDRECCLAAGMDDYLSKPVNPKELLATVDRLTAHVKSAVVSKEVHPAPQAAAKAAKTSAKESEVPIAPANDNIKPERCTVVDFQALMERVENDTTLLEEMIGLYLDTSPRLLSEIEAGVQRREANTIQRAAHALKGALQNLSAIPSAQAALSLEKMGRSGELEGAEQSLTELKDELQRLQTELAEWSKGVCV